MFASDFPFTEAFVFAIRERGCGGYGLK